MVEGSVRMAPSANAAPKNSSTSSLSSLSTPLTAQLSSAQQRPHQQRHCSTTLDGLVKKRVAAPSNASGIPLPRQGLRARGGRKSPTSNITNSTSIPQTQSSTSITSSKISSSSVTPKNAVTVRSIAGGALRYANARLRRHTDSSLLDLFSSSTADAIDAGAATVSSAPADDDQGSDEEDSLLTAFIRAAQQGGIPPIALAAAEASAAKRHHHAAKSHGRRNTAVTCGSGSSSSSNGSSTCAGAAASTTRSGIPRPTSGLASVVNNKASTATSTSTGSGSGTTPETSMNNHPIGSHARTGGPAGARAGVVVPRRLASTSTGQRQASAAGIASRVASGSNVSNPNHHHRSSQSPTAGSTVPTAAAFVPRSPLIGRPANMGSKEEDIARWCASVSPKYGGPSPAPSPDPDEIFLRYHATVQRTSQHNPSAAGPVAADQLHTTSSHQHHRSTTNQTSSSTPQRNKGRSIPRSGVPTSNLVENSDHFHRSNHHHHHQQHPHHPQMHSSSHSRQTTGTGSNNAHSAVPHSRNHHGLGPTSSGRGMTGNQSIPAGHRGNTYPYQQQQTQHSINSSHNEHGQSSSGGTSPNKIPASKLRKTRAQSQLVRPGQLRPSPAEEPGLDDVAGLLWVTNSADLDCGVDIAVAAAEGDDDAFHSPALLKTPSCSSGALNSAEVSTSSLSRSDMPPPSEADLATLLPLPSSLPLRTKPGSSSSAGKAGRHHTVAHGSSRRHHRRRSEDDDDAFRFPDTSGQARKHKPHRLDVADDADPQLAAVNSEEEEKPTVLRAHNYARHGAEIDIIPKASSAAAAGGDSPSIVPKNTSPHTLRHHRIVRQSSGSPRASPKFQPRSPTVSRESDSLILPGEGDPLPASMCEAGADAATGAGAAAVAAPTGSSNALMRIPSNQSDGFELQGSPSPGSNQLTPDCALSSSPQHLGFEQRRGSLRRKSSRGSTDSGAAAKAATTATDGKGWLLGRKLSMGKAGRLKKPSSRSLEDLSPQHDGHGDSLDSQKADDDEAEPAVGTNEVEATAEQIPAANLQRPSSGDKRSGKRLFGFANPRRWASGKNKKLEKASKSADIQQEYTFHPDPNRSSKLANPPAAMTLSAVPPSVMVTRSSVSSVDGQADGDQTMTSLISSSLPSSPLDHHLADDGPSSATLNTSTGTPSSSTLTSSTPTSNTAQAPAGPAPPWRTLLNMKKKMNPVDQLFDFIERQDFDGAEAIITQSPNFDINETNAEDHTPLDVAVMTDAVVIAKLIMKHGGKENPIFIKNRYIRSVRLTTLVTEAEEQVEKLTTSVVNLGGGMPNGVGVNHPQGSLTASSSKLKEYERQLRDWEWRYHTLRRMLQIYDRAKASEPPKWVKLSVMSPTALRVDFDEPEETNGAVVTRYKIVWSAFPDYTDSNEFVKTDLQVMCHIIEDLDEDVTYYVYVEAFNMQGYSAPCYSTPSCATPSNWRTAVNDCNTDGGSNGTDDAILTHVPDRSCTSHDTMMTLDGLAQSVLDADTEDALDSRGLKRNWFKMFGGKFTHTLEAGSLYLAVVNYTDDNRLQVTADGHLPILLVDQDHSVGQHSADIMWFSKICFNWKDTRSLKAMIGSDQSTATLVFRHKLLLAAIQAQLTFNQPNLGILHPDIITDFNKCTIVTVMKQVPRSQSAGSGNRWIPIPRFLRKRVHPDRPNTPGNVEKPDIGVSVSASTNSVRQDISPPPHSQNTSAYTLLVNQLLDVVSFHTNMHETLPRGLYVGLLKLRTTVSHMSVYTSRLHPLMLPYMKISDNPNVSRDEWLWLQRVMNQTQDSNVHPLPDEVTQHGRTFQQRLARGAARLLTKFNLDDGEEDVMENYHLYCREVIEVSDDITMVLLLPPADSLCLAPGQQCVLDENPDIVPLPLHYFELAHKVMFSQPFCDLYTRVSSVLDCRRLCSEQLSRKAFTKEETLAAQIELDEVNHLQSDLDAVWDKMRWVRDIVHQGKDKLPSCTVVLRRMFTAGVGTSSAHALPSFARRGARGVNTRRSLQHNSWSSNSVRLQQQQQLLLQQAKRQRNHLQRRASLETTEIFNDIVDKSNGPANGGANNSTTLRQGGDGGGGARDAGNRQATMPTNRRGSLPSVGYVGGAGSFSTLPRSSRRSSSTHGALLEERSESSHATGNAAVGHHSRSSAAMDRATQSASESNTVMSDPNISRHKADSAGNVHSHSVMHRRHAHAQAGSPDDELSRSFPHGSPVHALTDNMDKGRASPAPPKRSSSHAAMNVHRLSRTGSPQYSEDGGEHPPPYTSSSNSVSPDGTLGRQHAAQQRHHHTMTMATSPDGTFVQQGGNMGAVANAVGALEHTRGSPMNAHGTTPSPDSMTYSSSSYSGSSSASSTFSRSSSSRVNTGHAVATGNRSLSPSNSSGSFSSARSGGHVTSSSSPDEFGSGNIATLQLSAGSSSSNRSSTLPASTASRIHPSAPAGKTLYARTDSSGASTFQRTPPLRRKQPGGASAVTQHQQSQAEEQSHHLTHQHAAPPSAGNAKRSSVPTGPTTSSSSQQPPVHGGDGQFGRFGARVPAPQQAPPPPTYAHPQRHNTTTTAAAATNHHSPASSFASVDRAARPHGRPRRSISDTSFGSPPSQQQQQKQQYEQQQQHVQQQQQSSTARVMRTQATQSHLHRRTYLETGGDSGSDRSARSSPTPAGSLLTPGGISTSGANWVRVFPLFASPQLLAKGTNIKIKITPTTSCREVIELVMDEVRRLTSGSTRAQSLILDINAYCLVSKVEGRDCPLPDDFKPLELADQESRRQMYIRERSAAEQMLQQGQSTSV